MDLRVVRASRELLVSANPGVAGGSGCKAEAGERTVIDLSAGETSQGAGLHGFWDSGFRLRGPLLPCYYYYII